MVAIPQEPGTAYSGEMVPLPKFTVKVIRNSKGYNTEVTVRSDDIEEILTEQEAINRTLDEMFPSRD